MKIFFILFVLLSHLLFAEGRGEQSLEKVSVQLHWRYQFEFAGFIAAKEKGFYKDAGLDVDLKEYKFGINIVDEVLSQRSTYGVYNSNILIEYLQNRKINLLASYFKRSALVLITKPTIKSPQDLVGKTIMATGQEDFDLNFRPLFDVYKIKSDSFNFVKHTYNIEDFIKNKNIDAMTAFVSDQPYKLDKLGVKYNIISPSDYGTFNLQLELFTSDEELHEHKLRTEKFRDATTKGWEYALSHQDEMVNIIHQKYAHDISVDDLKHEAKGITKLILPYTYSVGSIDKNFLNRQMEIFKANYHIKSDKTIDSFIVSRNEDTKSKFTEAEIAYLTQHHQMKICVRHDQFPYDGYTDHTYMGIMPDIYGIIAKDLDLKFISIASKSEEEMTMRIKNYECDLVSIVPTGSNSLTNIVTTKPLIKSYFTLIGTLDKPFIGDPTILRDKKLLVPSLMYKKYLLKLYPYLDINVDPDINNIVKKVLQGEAYAAVEVDLKADYLINKYGYGKFKINGFLAKENPLCRSIGVREDQSLLLSIMQKEIGNIPPQQIENIVNSWRLTRYKEGTDYGLVLKILIALGFIISIMAYYQRKLKRFNSELAVQVKIKTHELQEINESLEKTVHEKVEELIQKDKLLSVQSKQAVMGEMISMIAHQWRQPLSTITLQISNLEIKKMMGITCDIAEYNNTLCKISETILYLSETVDDFQTYFRPDRKHTTVEIHELLQKVLNLTQPRADEKKIKIFMEKEYEIYIKVYANELIQVVLNLINNAIDSLSTVTKENKFIHLHVSRKDENISIFIEDNGAGISAENIEKLFEPYFSTKGKNGTGLGLYMSKMIIEKQFFGSIKVESLNEKTCFVIQIPKHEI